MFPFNKQQPNSYPISRNTVYAKNGMVATSQPLAAQAGLDILKKGGNAIDAAIAAAACKTVVEPTSNGIGGDAFAIVWTKGKIYGLNGSGKSPNSISIEAIKEMGYKEIPKYGWVPVTIPGAPGMWAELSKKLGRLSLSQTLEPAISYANEGFPISPTMGRYWKRAYGKFEKALTGEEFQSWFETFTSDGKVPEIGEVWSSPDHAKTLSSIGETNARSFYEGEIAKKINDFSKETGGFITTQDLKDYKPEWVNPISINYRGYDVWELPPNGQGIIALQALNILKGLNFTEADTVSTYHKQIEAMKLAFADGLNYITDGERMDVSIKQLLSEKYSEKRRNLIKETAISPESGNLSPSGTVYLSTADGEGNMVSFIQSNYTGFGSGIVVPGTGIALQNRGFDFSMNPHHANALEGGKRTFHTMMPGFLTKDNTPIGPFGVMGGLMMPQGHVQVLMNTIDFKMSPQAALDAPRWQWKDGMIVEVEPRFKHHLSQALENKGHEIVPALEPNGFGRGQIIWRDPETGILAGGTESRTDGSIASW